MGLYENTVVKADLHLCCTRTLIYPLTGGIATIYSHRSSSYYPTIPFNSTHWLFLILFLHVLLRSVAFPFKSHQEDYELKSPIMSIETSLALLLRLQILLEIHVSFLFKIISYMCIIILKIMFLCLLTTPRRLMETVYSGLFQVHCKTKRI